MAVLKFVWNSVYNAYHHTPGNIIYNAEQSWVEFSINNAWQQLACFI